MEGEYVVSFDPAQPLKNGQGDIAALSIMKDGVIVDVLYEKNAETIYELLKSIGFGSSKFFDEEVRVVGINASNTLVEDDDSTVGVMGVEVDLSNGGSEVRVLVSKREAEAIQIDQPFRCVLTKVIENG